MERSLASARVTLLLSACLLAMMFIGGARVNAAPEFRSKESGILFAVSGGGATMTPIPGARDRYELTVERPERTAVWFTDRPERDSGTVSTAWLVSEWSALGFAKEPPNVAIALHRPRGETDTIVAVMRRPVLTKSGTFRAVLRVLSSNEAQALTGHLTQHGKDHDPVGIPARLGAVSIFIDTAQPMTPPPPCPGDSCNAPGPAAAGATGAY